ncbi:T9SS type A sorting domain-containing protein [Lewinella sp. JB7]|uniref:T9SS type A sorting domain-containing protein n=1 Tax=Lewinella sp. JB7 TaxID=2962887 RepID=UPI0020C9774A|nr:T9SS type A sorting domain-containing protein [Lewinella sp. JB7]MCP9236861.1 T9SS type A sorting domain-containing protein [Lewinella sp. JB7]
MRHYLLPALILLVTGLGAQDCFYQLRLQDSGGDGYRGAAVTVTVAGVPRTFTLDATVDDGSRRDFFIPVNNGDAVNVGYRAEAFPEEVSFSIFDNNDSLIYRVEAPETNANLTAFTANCRACAPPPLSSIELYRVRYNSVDIRFRSTPAAAGPTYLIEYGPGDFDPAQGEGTRVTTQDTMLRITGLAPTTTYTFYVSTTCQTPEETTVRRGPFRIRTPLQKDIGVTRLVKPIEKCAGSTSDSVTIAITNFGGEAQQFFEVDFTLNDAPSGVNTPFDGIYTGVLGVDSTKNFTFDAMADLSVPGYYNFKVFTKLEGDENPANDTLDVSVLSVPVISTFPYVQGFESGTGFWRDERAGAGPSTWQRAKPGNTLIDRAGSGSYAYVTNARGDYSNDERSYLRSPCFDFSGLATDPFLSFLLYVDTEENFDRLFLESSTDGGNSWQRLDRNPTSINWYNNGRDRVWDGDGGFGGGYALVGQQLSGLKGADKVQLRFVFTSDGDGQREGVSIDDIRITAGNETDLAAVSARVAGYGSCNETGDTLQFTFTDVGTQRVDSVTVSYRVGDGEVNSTRAAAPATRGGRRTVTFVADLGVTAPDPVTIRAWVMAEGDTTPENDTTTLVFQPVRELPFLVDFENGRRPTDWLLDGDLVIARRAGNPSVTLADNLSARDTALSFTTARYGPVAAQDSLRFSLALTPTTDGEPAGGTLRVSALMDCDDEATVLTEQELTAGSQEIALPLDFAGESVRFLVEVEWSTGDFFVDIDDLRVRRCTGSLDIRVTTDPPSGIFADDGTAYLTVRGGLSPYSYAWSTGDTTQSVGNLSVADYSVTVTDVLGCTNSRTISIDLTAVATQNEGALPGLELFPNPTSDRIEVRLALQQSRELEVEVYDPTGRRVEWLRFGTGNQLTATIDLGNRPAGLYFIRVRAGEETRTVRVVRR